MYFYSGPFNILPIIDELEYKSITADSVKLSKCTVL